MRAHAQSVFRWRHSTVHHCLEFAPQLDSHRSNMAVPISKLLRCVQATKIQVTVPIPEPTTHLHQGIVHTACSEVIRHGQALQCQASGQFVASDSDHIYSVRMLVIVKDIAGLTIDELHADSLSGFSDFPSDVLPGNWLVPKLTQLIITPNRLKLVLPNVFQLHPDGIVPLFPVAHPSYELDKIFLHEFVKLFLHIHEP